LLVIYLVVIVDIPAMGFIPPAAEYPNDFYIGPVGIVENIPEYGEHTSRWEIGQSLTIVDYYLVACRVSDNLPIGIKIGRVIGKE